MALSLIDEFRSVVDALARAEVDYAVVGAMALAIHGAPRATTDIDLLVRPDDVARVLEIVAPLGYDLPALPMTFAGGISVQRVTKVTEDDLLTLDLLLVSEPLVEIWKSRSEIAALNRSLWVVSREGLIRMKALAGRLQDLADIERLREAGDA